MSKQVQKIKAEIERQIEATESSVTACILADILRFIDSVQKEPGCDDLEEFATREADEFAEREYEIGSFDKSFLSKGFYWGAKAGADWQKEQIMKDAIELEFGWLKPHIYAETDRRFDIGNFDKVKVILIKEE